MSNLKFENSYYKIIQKLKINYKSVFLLLLLKIFLGELVIFICNKYFNSHNFTKVNYLNHFSFLTKIILSVIVAPLFETWFNYYLIFKLFKYLNNFFKLNNIKIFNFIYVIFCSFLFAINHQYNVVTIIYAFISGIIYSIFYLKSLNKYNAFLNLTLLHSLYNLYANVRRLF